MSSARVWGIRAWEIWGGAAMRMERRQITIILHSHVSYWRHQWRRGGWWGRWWAIVLLHGHRGWGGVDIDDDVGEPPSASDEVLDFSHTGIIGAPEGWMPPSCPTSFTGYKPRQGDPSEEELDNPAGWSMFTFTPSYHSKTKKYEGACGSSSPRTDSLWLFNSWTGRQSMLTFVLLLVSSCVRSHVG